MPNIFRCFEFSSFETQFINSSVHGTCQRSNFLLSKTTLLWSTLQHYCLKNNKTKFPFEKCTLFFTQFIIVKIYYHSN